MSSLQLWQLAGLTFFLYVVQVLAWRGAGTRTAGWRVLAGSGAGVVIVLLSALSGQPAMLTDWIWPPLVLLISYWTSGWLFVAPIASQERLLASFDRRASILNLGRRSPRLIAELLEAAYLGVYALIPIALIIHLAFGEQPCPSRFWAVVLITDFTCFGALPWVQTRPPRSLERTEPWTSSIRSVNLRVLGSASIHVNTCPSGHAAEALATALLVLDAPAYIVGTMLIAACAVAAGAVLGRYHYLADALAGWVVAVVVWAIVHPH
jgi:hypothetical protein